MIWISVVFLFNTFSSAEVIRYKISSGDTLWSIASKYLGNGNKWYIIYGANRDIIKDPNIIMPSTLIDIPLPEKIDSGHSQVKISTITSIIDDATQTTTVDCNKLDNQEEIVDIKEVDKNLSKDFPSSQTSFDIASKRFKIKKRDIIAEVSGRNSIIKTGDYIEFKSGFKCQDGIYFAILKKVFEFDDYLVADMSGVCIVKSCLDGVFNCLIDSSNREIRTGDIIIKWKKKN